MGSSGTMEGSRARARPRRDILLRDNMGETISGATCILRSGTRRTAQTLQHNIGPLARLRQDKPGIGEYFPNMKRRLKPIVQIPWGERPHIDGMHIASRKADHHL